MKVARLITNSFETMVRYKLRSGVMMLGSLVGVAVLTLIVSVGEGAERKMLTTARQLFGASSIMVLAGGTHFMGGPRGDAARLTIDDIEALANELPEIAIWDAQQALDAAAVRRGDATATVRVLGQSERFPAVWGRNATQGESFEASAVKSSARVALIGETAARTLFDGGDPLGAEILIESVPFKVIGILEPFGTDMHGMDRDNEIVVPISTLMRRLMNVDTISAAKLLVEDAERAQRITPEIIRILRARHRIAAGQPDDFKLLTPIEVQRMIHAVQRVLDFYLPIVASIALIVGAIVTAVLMLAAVSERVSEIGLRRAVGAEPGDIRLQFLLEAATTMLAGGLGGIVLGFLGAQFLASRMHLGEIFSWKAMFLGIAVSVMAGLIAGVAPAQRAARLHPADALR